jgi:hypothetical protein
MGKENSKVWKSGMMRNKDEYKNARPRDREDS